MYSDKFCFCRIQLAVRKSRMKATGPEMKLLLYWGLEQLKPLMCYCLRLVVHSLTSLLNQGATLRLCSLSSSYSSMSHDPLFITRLIVAQKHGRTMLHLCVVQLVILVLLHQFIPAPWLWIYNNMRPAGLIKSALLLRYHVERMKCQKKLIYSEKFWGYCHYNYASIKNGRWNPISHNYDCCLLGW